MDRPPSRKCAKGTESVGYQRFPPLIVSSHAGGHWFESSSLHHENTLISLKSGCFYNFFDAFSRTGKGCTTKIRQFCEYRRKNTEEKPLRFLFCIRIGPVFQQSLTQRLGAGVVVDLRQHLQVTVSQQACHHVRVDALSDPERGSGMAQLVG